MDTFPRDVSQFYRPGIKRPWEDSGLPEQSNGWRGSQLPPINAVPYKRPSITQHIEHGPENQYRHEGRDSAAKKSRLEGNDYNGVGRVNRDPPSKNAQLNLEHTENRRSQDNAAFAPSPRKTPAENANSRESNMQPERRRLTSLDQDGDYSAVSECCEHCQKSPELAFTTHAAAAGLTKLAETLRSGIASEKRGIVPGSDQIRLPNGDCPPIVDFGLQHTLDWILGKIDKANELADRFVESVAVNSLRNLDKDARNGAFAYNMKRRIDADLEGHSPTRSMTDSTPSEAKPYNRQRSLTLAMSGNEELSPMASQTHHHPSMPLDPMGQRASTMNPPPTPNRQLPSPPGRSFPSPTSLNFSSPSSSSYGLSQPANLHTSSTQLPPINTVHPGDSALQAHTAALQHEVSVQKIALSSLQSEHDKLLAAFSRSKTRASALEKKHAVSDGEIISLTEEKLRLQSQVLELEKDVEELSRSRDRFRQAAVEEGAQYVEIVKMASQLEEKAGEERRNWNKLKAEMEQRIEALSAGIDEEKDHAGVIDVHTLASSGEMLDALKLESGRGPRLAEPTLQPDPSIRLRAEIERLRRRCEEVETTLCAVRDESRSMESIVEALSRAGKGILQRVENVAFGRDSDPEV